MVQSVLKNNIQSQSIQLLNTVLLVVLILSGQIDPMAIVFSYIFETIIIGVIHVLKLICIIYHKEIKKGKSKAIDYLSVLFFIVHFGGFVVIQSGIIYTVIAIQDERFSTSLSGFNFYRIFGLEGFYLGVFTIIATRIASFYFSFLKQKKYLNQEVEVYFIKPYLRIFLQQFVAIIPVFFLFFSSKIGMIAALLLIVFRAILDFYLSQIAHNPLQLRKLALKMLSKDKPEELESIEKITKTFLEE